MKLVLMTNLPAAGKVNTRLAPPLTFEQAAELHRIFVCHVSRKLAGLGQLVICFDPCDAEPSLRRVLDVEARYLTQAGGNLGERLAAAFATIGENGAIFFGADTPDVPATAVQHAIRLMRHHDVVTGPCDDGGFWCIGMAENVDAVSLLSEVQWSSGRELGQTLDRASRLGYHPGMAEPWCAVNRVDDLRRLVSRLRKSDNADDMRLLKQIEFLPPEMMS